MCVSPFFSVLKQNQDRKHRTYVYVLTVTEILEDWEDSVNIGKTFFLMYLFIMLYVGTVLFLANLSCNWYQTC